MNPNVTEAKRRLRSELSAAVHALGSSARAEGSRAICERVSGQGIWRTARTMLLYAPMGDEVDIAPLIQVAVAQGKRVAFPRFISAAREYVGALVERPERDLVPGHFGILEPGPACPGLDLGEVDLTLVPGLGFTPGGGVWGGGGVIMTGCWQDRAGFGAGLLLIAK